MKKAVLLAAVGMLVLASCKKEYTCVCFYIEDGEKAAPYYELEEDNPVFLSSENRATNACNDLTMLMDSTVVCEIQ
ncbi:MAG: hypothetical protein AB8B74_11515 [Crocinitomicaceae bacterium]